ncbi:MAG: iron transporter, partial [Salinibacter sp.]
MNSRLISLVLPLAFIVISLGPASALAQERVLGEETIDPGIQLTFEAAPQDDVTPYDQNLSEETTDVHLEVLVGWSEESDVDVPEGVTRGGFVGYLKFF